MFQDQYIDKEENSKILVSSIVNLLISKKAWILLAIAYNLLNVPLIGQSRVILVDFL